jgi:hypothetical protein
VKAHSSVAGSASEVTLEWRYYSGGGGDNESLEHILAVLDGTTGAWRSMSMGAASVFKFAGLKKTKTSCIVMKRTNSSVTNSSREGSGPWKDDEVTLQSDFVPWPIYVLASMVVLPPTGNYLLNSSTLQLSVQSDRVRIFDGGSEIFSFEVQYNKTKAMKRGLVSSTVRLWGSLQSQSDNRFEGDWKDDPLKSCAR